MKNIRDISTWMYIYVCMYMVMVKICVQNSVAFPLDMKLLIGKRNYAALVRDES